MESLFGGVPGTLVVISAIACLQLLQVLNTFPLNTSKLEKGRQAKGLNPYEPMSKLLVSPLITPIVLPYIIPYITPFKEFRL